ncbi:hypothetical protein MKW92_027825, partial [Papaver armeniacum]
MAEIVIGPLVEIAAENGILAFTRQVRYCINYKKSARNLAIKVKELKDMSTDIQNRVIAAKKNLDSIKRVVVTWLERVNKEADQDEMVLGSMRFVRGEDAEIFNHGGCCKGWCCLLNRRKIGKESEKKIVVINELLKQGREFGEISDPYSDAVTEIITKSTKSEDSVAFASQESIRKQVLRALKDERTFSVGIYGMGGVGKTTLKNQIHKQVIEEKLFKTVITIVVSQNVDLKNMQNRIAEALQFRRLETVSDEITRAALLKERLRQEEQVLVIFDDLWTRDLDLCDVGIPFCHKDCKILITTRFLEVCDSLKIQQNFKLKVLSDEDSWHLFKKNAGDAVESSALQAIAREVVKECGCLPLALVTVGKALRNKDQLEWEYTANQLKNSNFTDIEGMTSKVYTSIKLSYDFLGNDILKRCFLICCLFPDDYIIMIYAFGDEVICRDLEKWADVWVRLHKALVKLVALGLLIGSKMHDVVRDVAISIASKEGYGFYVKTGLSLRNWPETGISSTTKCSRISLFQNDIAMLPDQPELPHLLSLSLRGNISLTKIPDRFFENLSTLQSLDISRTGISMLPLSLSSLFNLRSLDMSCCKLHSQLDLSGLGKLKKLEILNLAYLGLTITLPEEIGELSCLKWLDLSHNPGLTVPPGPIARLTCLEYLNMVKSFERWEVGEIIDESCSSSPFPNSVKVLMTNVKNVLLDVCSGLKSVGTLVTSSRGFNNLKILKVSKCHEMECFLSVVKEEIPKATFSGLEVLTLESLGNLKEIFHGPMPVEFSLENLRRVKLINCRALVHTFSHENHYDDDNDDDDDDDDDDGGDDGDHCSSRNDTTHLNLGLLPHIKNIWDGIPSLWNITSITVATCGRLKHLIPIQVLVSGGLSQLTSVFIYDCKHLEAVFCHDDVVVADQQNHNILENLEKLIVRECKSLKYLLPKSLVAQGGLRNLEILEVK